MFDVIFTWYGGFKSKHIIHYLNVDFILLNISAIIRVFKGEKMFHRRARPRSRLQHM